MDKRASAGHGPRQSAEAEPEGKTKSHEFTLMPKAVLKP